MLLGPYKSLTFAFAFLENKKRPNKIGIVCLCMTALRGADGAAGASIWKVIVTDYVSDGPADSGINNMLHIEKNPSVSKKVKECEW